MTAYFTHSPWSIIRPFKLNWPNPIIARAEPLEYDSANVQPCFSLEMREVGPSEKREPILNGRAQPPEPDPDKKGGSLRPARPRKREDPARRRARCAWEYSEYADLCCANRVHGKEEQLQLVEFLHDLGIVLHYRDHPILQETTILNPHWVTKAVYLVLNHRVFWESHGVVEMRELRRVLPEGEYPSASHMVFIMAMMERFELAFGLPGNADFKFLVPGLLPLEAPDTGRWNNSVRLEYHYDVLPISIVLRFIVRMHECVSKSTYWRRGVVLASEDARNRAIVRADMEDNTISIGIDGLPDSKRRF